VVQDVHVVGISAGAKCGLGLAFLLGCYIVYIISSQYKKVGRR
jgi:hypothetical protein